MNHDITHCSEKDCPKANTCVRYLAYLELRKYPDKWDKDKKHSSFTVVRRKPCKLYWENKDGLVSNQYNMFDMDDTMGYIPFQTNE